jgi:2-C-methyl-D-erythritol 4-phosphate cytidylyltransferase
MKIRRNVAIVVAGGTGSRFGENIPKQYMELGGKPIICHCLDLFERCDLIDEVLVVVGENYLGYVSQAIVDKYSYRKIKKITTGGETRQESVLSGLSSCSKSIDLAIIHDAVRPFLAMDLLKSTIKKATETEAAILAVPAKESIKEVSKNLIKKSLLRDSIWIAQTPQIFKFEKILDAHRRAEAAQNEATDDSQLYEQYCGKVSIIRGSYNNIKITTKSDYILAKELYKEIM